VGKDDVLSSSTGYKKSNNSTMDSVSEFGVIEEKNKEWINGEKSKGVIAKAWLELYEILWQLRYTN